MSVTLLMHDAQFRCTARVLLAPHRMMYWTGTLPGVGVGTVKAVHWADVMVCDSGAVVLPIQAAEPETHGHAVVPRTSVM